MVVVQSRLWCGASPACSAAVSWSELCSYSPLSCRLWSLGTHRPFGPHSPSLAEGSGACRWVGSSSAPRLLASVLAGTACSNLDMMGSHVRQPNKRLKLAGGNRFKGSGVLCPWRGTDYVHHPCAYERVARSLSAIR